MNCPNCLHPLDAHTCVSDNEAKGPEVGDTTVCLYCASVLIYVGKGLRPIMEGDLRRMSSEDVLLLSQAQALVAITRVQDRTFRLN